MQGFQGRGIVGACTREQSVILSGCRGLSGCHAAARSRLLVSMTTVLVPCLLSCLMRRRSRLILLSAQRKQALKSRRRFSMRARTSRMICPKPLAGSVHADPLLSPPSLVECPVNC